MLKEIIKAYEDGKIAFINKISQINTQNVEEVLFLDDGYIRSKIKELKEQYNSLSSEIDLLIKYDKNDEYSKSKISYLREQCKDIKLEIAFLASNNYKNLDNCINLVEDIDTDFKLCIYALRFYYDGNSQRAYQYFGEYFKDKDRFLEHYLINKVYGELLFSIKEYNASANVLRKAVEKRPEDIEIHRILKEIYKLNGQLIEEKIEESILNLLEDK